MDTPRPQKSCRKIHQTCLAAVFGSTFTLVLFAAPEAQPSESPPQATSAITACSPEERRQTLRTMQAEVEAAAPAEIQSMKSALAPGGALAGWRLSHGYVVLATAGAIVVDNMQAKPPLPQLLAYEPAASSTPDGWLDFEGPDDPYRLVGWAYAAPYATGPAPPRRRCIEPTEWLVHEAGWHLKDGGMQLTPSATTEPPRPTDLAIHMWHPAVWDLHVWRGNGGVPTVAFANPNARRGGKHLPKDAFFYLVDGERRVPALSRR